MQESHSKLQICSPNDKVGEVARSILDEWSHDSVLVEANEEDFTKAFYLAESLNMMPYHRTTCNWEERLAEDDPTETDFQQRARSCL